MRFRILGLRGLNVVSLKDLGFRIHRFRGLASRRWKLECAGMGMRVWNKGHLEREREGRKGWRKREKESQIAVVVSTFDAPVVVEGEKKSSGRRDGRERERGDFGVFFVGKGEMKMNGRVPFSFTLNM